MVLSSVGAFAQYEGGEFTLQPKVGLNCATLTNWDNNEYKAGLVIGAEAEYHIKNWLGISGGVLYSQQGLKVKDVDTKMKLDYVNVPILANFYVAKGLALKAGLQPGFLVNAKVGDLDIKDACEKFDLSVPVGISYEYAGFCLDARYNVGTTKVFKGDTEDYDKSSKNEVFQLTIGYKFHL